MGIDFTNEQVYMIYDLEQWWMHRNSKQLFQISGRGGTGKTTCIKYFIERIGLHYDEVLFLAYMGKACVRMVQDGLPAKTIHSAIYEHVREKKRDENGKLILTESGKPVYTYKFILKEKLPKRIRLIVIDEGSMVPENIALDILSFGIPTVVLGDLNQLPPVFGKPYFLNSVDAELTKIMRQKEGDPIIWLGNEVIEGRDLAPGIYGKSAVIRKEEVNESLLKSADVIITGTNRLRHNINNYFRERIRKVPKMDRIYIREKIICRKNNWSRTIGDGIFLMNGLTGFVDRVYHGSFNGKTLTIDFRPDFATKTFKEVVFDYKHLYEVPGQETSSLRQYNDVIEFAYAITCHSSQGSAWDRVVYMSEPFLGKEDNKKMLYTAISRAKDSVVVVI